MPLQCPESAEQTEAYAQASAWLARLHSGERTQDDVDAFYRWLEQGALQQSAFDEVTTSWELAGSLTDIPRQPVTHAGTSRRKLLVGACVGACAVGFGGIAAFRWEIAGQGETLSSNIGEIRRLTLADGSRLVLDTDSAVHVRFGDGERRVTLLRGRTYVEVAKDAARPFSVTADDQRVVARGTAFDVALAGDGMQVLLTEGLVDVIGNSGARNVLTPGQRLSYAQGSVSIDEPDPRKLVAWQSGRLIFDNDTLASAIAAMNRYDRRQIRLADPALAGYRLSGAYATGNTWLFAQSIGQLLDLRAVSRADEITIYGNDASSSTAT